MSLTDQWGSSLEPQNINPRIDNVKQEVSKQPGCTVMQKYQNYLACAQTSKNPILPKRRKNILDMTMTDVQLKAQFMMKIRDNLKLPINLSRTKKQETKEAVRELHLHVCAVGPKPLLPNSTGKEMDLGHPVFAHVGPKVDLVGVDLCGEFLRRRLLPSSPPSSPSQFFLECLRKRTVVRRRVEKRAWFIFSRG